MYLRVERVDRYKAYKNYSYLAANFELEEGRSRGYVGRLQEVLQLQIGSQPLVLLRVLWFCQKEPDPVLPWLHRVRVGGTGRVYEPDQLIEAHRIEAQVWLTDIPDTPTWKRVHYKFPSSFRIPAHLRQTV